MMLGFGLGGLGLGGMGGVPPLARYAVGGALPALVLDFERGYASMQRSLTRASAGTYIGADGLIASAAINAERYYYSGGSRALLLESAATRLNGYVSIRSALASSVSGAVLTDLSENALGQFGGMSVASAGLDYSRAGINVPVTSGQTYAVKVLWKPGTSPNVRFVLRLQEASQQSMYGGAVGALGLISNAAGPITLYADRSRGSYRETVLVFTPGATGTCQMSIGPYSTVAGETVNAYAWQVEAGAADSSWILGDAGVAVTRAADVVAPIDISGLGLSAGYTLVVWGQLDAVASGFDRVVQLDTGDNTNRHLVYWTASGARLKSEIFAADTQQAVLDASGGPQLGQPFKMAFAVGPNYFNSARNGIAGTLDTSVNCVTPTALRLASYANGSKTARLLLSRVALYPMLMDTTQLAGVTA